MTPKAYCRKYGYSSERFARKVGITQSFAWRILNAERKVSAAMAVKIEKRTKGEITKYDLRPDFFGRRPTAAAVRGAPPSNDTVSLRGQPEQTAPALQAAQTQQDDHGKEA